MRDPTRPFVHRPLVAVTLLAVLPLACRHSPPPVQMPPPAPVEAVRPWRTSLDSWTALSGTTQALPNHRAQITASVAGVVASMPATEGQWVEAGQTIVRLDRRIAEQNLAKSDAMAKELEAQRKQAENTVQVARDSLRRLQNLYNSTASSNLPLASKPELEQAQAALVSAQSQLQVIEAKQASSAADIKALQQQLGLYTLRAPIAGWLSTVHVTPGQTIAVGTNVADVVDLKQIDAVCFVPPSRRDRLALKQPARLVSDGTGDKAHAEARGEVVYVARQAQPDTGNFEVKVRFPNEQLGLPANTVVNVLVRTTPPEDRLVIPDAALMVDQEPPEVAVVPTLHTVRNEQVGKVRLRQAVIGVWNRQRHLVEIRGLRDPTGGGEVPTVPNAWYVVAGGTGLEDGDTVRVREQKPGAGN